MGNVLFSGARAAYLSTTLLGGERLKRMIDGDFGNALKVLSETGFGAGASDGFSVDALIEKETTKLAEFIRTASPNGIIRDFFLLPYDFRNAESIVKAKFLKTEPVTNACGTIDPKVLKERIFSDDYKGLPEFMAKALSESDRLFVEGSADGNAINVLFVNGLYEQLFDLKTEKTLREVLTRKADCLNIGIALRSRNFERAKRQFVKRGRLTDNELKTLCESDFNEITEKFAFSDYKAEISAAVNGLENGSLKEFERISESRFVKEINKERFSTEGIMPFIRYCAYKFADITNVRVILVGLSVGIPREEITLRLREHYEG